MWFIIGAIKYVLENMYFRYIKKKKNLQVLFFFIIKKRTYSGAFESAGIGLLNYINSRPIPVLLKVPVQVGNLIPTITVLRFEAPGKKTLG